MGKAQRRREREALAALGPPEPPRIPQMGPITVEGQTFIVSVHAARRWQERVRMLDDGEMAELRRDIQNLAQWATVAAEPPEWHGPSDEPEPDAWIMFGPDIAMPVTGGLCATTLVRGSLGPAAREYRNRVRKSMRAGKRMSSKSHRGGNSTPGRKHPDKLRLNDKRHRRKMRERREADEAAA